MGIKFPFGESPKYPPRDWSCPECKKYHSKPHYAFPGQIDYSKKPTESGRVKFNREGSGMACDDYKLDTEIIENKTGPEMVDGKNQPLFCPHCGWEGQLLYITKTVPQTKRKKKWLR